MNAQQTATSNAASGSIPQESLPDEPALGQVSGAVQDVSGGMLPGATVSLQAEGAPDRNTQTTDASGRFAFQAVRPGHFSLAIEAPGFAAASSRGVLKPGEPLVLQPQVLQMSGAESDISVHVSHAELATEEVRAEEHQRVFGAIPNFMVTYNWHAVSLSPRQKFALAWKLSIDPVTFAIVAGVAGVQQQNGAYVGYGFGAQGYGKRYGADYADQFVGTMLGSGLLPVLFKQDPRYFYMGAGSKRKRALYAMESSVMCRSDSGKWEFNYSNVLGSFAAGGISNIYYPASDRNGAGLTIANGIIGIASNAVGNLFQEFVVRKLTPHLPPPQPAPQP